MQPPANGTLLGGAVAAVVGGGAPQSEQAGSTAEGSQVLAQAPPLQTAAVNPAARATSPDRGVGAATASAMQGLVESNLQKAKRAEDSTHEELMQRRPAAKAPKGPVAAKAMEVDLAGEIDEKTL